jgi:hypothetical protein
LNVNHFDQRPHPECNALFGFEGGLTSIKRSPHVSQHEGIMRDRIGQSEVEFLFHRMTTCIGQSFLT